MDNFERYGILQEKGRRYENIIYVMAMIYGMLEREISVYFQKYNFSGPKFNILMVAAFQNEGRGINQVELGRRLITTAGNVTKLVESLYKDKLITRAQNKNNRRENVVKITPRGRAFIEKLWPEYDKLLKKRTDLISAANQERMSGILKNWFFDLDKIYKEQK
ncbi:MAG: MarR family transcriptional regulator [Elusimicrobium sp.]|jgi:MarR family 2-MHQ and catechol resistance regulon transcriptional repressor|nr:MarR family transcriptional regulator [Elusimicrobium sp.]